MLIRKYHIFKKNMINCCCNPNAYMIFEEYDTGFTKVTNRLKHGNKFLTIGSQYFKTGSIELKTCTYLRYK